MTRHHLEVNLLGGLRQLAAGGQRGALLGPPGREAASAVWQLLRDEAAAYLRIELEVASQRLAALQRAIDARGDAPGEVFLRDALERQQRTHTDLLEAQRGIERDLEAVQRVFVVAARETAPAEAPLLIELHDDGWAMAGDDAQRRAERRAFLGLPPGRDWVEREGV